jgi:hypothetical protein
MAKKGWTSKIHHLQLQKKLNGTKETIVLFFVTEDIHFDTNAQDSSAKYTAIVEDQYRNRIRSF